MDYYSILQVEPNAELSDIRKSYKKLVIKHHPDKNNDKDSHAKFVDINTAYQVLSDENRRLEYDRLNIYQRGQLYDLLKDSLEHLNIFSENQGLFKSMVEYYYGDESDFKKDINNFNFKNIYNKFYTKLAQSQFDFELDSHDCNFDHDVIIPFSERNLDRIKDKTTKPLHGGHTKDKTTKPSHGGHTLKQSDIPIYNRSEVSIDNVNDYEMDIHGVIYTNLADRYSNKYKKITVTRQSNNTTETFIVPLILPDIIIPQKGNQAISNEKYGDVIIKIICKEHPEYKQINDSDIVLVKYITLYQYLYGGKFQIILPDNTEFDIEFNSFIEKVPIICMQNNGLPVLNDNNVPSDKQSNGIGLTRGNLYIYIKIDGIDQMKQQIEENYN